MTRNHIWHQVFSGRTRSIVCEHLTQLRVDGLVQSMFDCSLQKKNNFYYQICEKGFDVVKRSHPHEIIGNPKTSYAANHDLGLTDIREKLQVMPSITRYTTENMLNYVDSICNDERFNSYIEVQSDAVIDLRVNDEILRGALEYEPTCKNLERYRKKIYEYYVRKDIRFVFYICTNGSTVRAIRRIEDELKPEGETKLYFTLFDNIMKSTDVLTFQGRREAFLRIK